MSEVNNDSKDKNEKNKSNKGSGIIVWPLIAGVVTIGFGILLLTLRVIVPSFIIALTGIILIIYWIYVTKNKSRVTGQRNEVVCTCIICEHSQSSTCIKQKCICCSIAKGDRIVGHTNNPLQ